MSNVLHASAVKNAVVAEATNGAGLAYNNYRGTDYPRRLRDEMEASPTPKSARLPALGTYSTSY